MKKVKNLHKLALHKKAISNLNQNTMIGGQQESSLILASALLCTRWDGCDLPTIGSGDGSNCISTDGEGWCGGR